MSRTSPSGRRVDAQIFFMISDLDDNDNDHLMSP
jgi:hypothetical protein